MYLAIRYAIRFLSFSFALVLTRGMSVCAVVGALAGSRRRCCLIDALASSRERCCLVDSLAGSVCAVIDALAASG